MCHSYSAHLYERLGAELGALDGMTMKQDFCDELVEECADEIPGIARTYAGGLSYCEKHVGSTGDQFWSYPYTERESNRPRSNRFLQEYRNVSRPRSNRYLVDCAPWNVSRVRSYPTVLSVGAQMHTSHGPTPSKGPGVPETIKSVDTYLDSKENMRVARV